MNSELFFPTFSLYKCVADLHALNSDQKRRPTAAELLGHPYLELHDNWVFPGLQNLGEPPSTIPTEGSESQSGGTQSTDSTARQTSTRQPEHSSHFLPRAESPPLVTIAPPPPRQRTNTGNTIDWMRSRSPSVTGSESSTSQKSSQHSTASRRKLVVHNPDHAPDFATGKGKEKESPSKSFVYEPPPLPPVDGSVPYSTYLAPIPATRFGSTPNLNTSPQIRDSRSRQHSASPSALQAPSRYNKAGPANLKAAMMANRFHSVDDTMSVASDADTIVTSSSTWKIPPRPLPILSPAKSRHRGNPRHSSIVANSRPNSRQVLGNLHTYFPHHNLDAEVETPVEPEFQPNRHDSVARPRVLKSIKTIAAEKFSKDKDMASPVRRRQTWLWDMPTEEIKPHLQNGELS